MNDSKYKSNWAKRRRESLRQQGLCTICGINAPVNNGSLCQECRDRRNQNRRRRHAENPQLRQVANKAWREANHHIDEVRKGRSRRRIRAEVLQHYGGQCECCREDHPVFLTIDHIEGGGTAHRRALPKDSGALCRWIKDNNYPKGFRVLRWNCNYAYYLLGECPHSAFPSSSV